MKLEDIFKVCFVILTFEAIIIFKIINIYIHNVEIKISILILFLEN